MNTQTDPCEEFEIAALRQARGALDAPAVALLEAHLVACADCRGFAATAEATETALRTRARAATDGRDWDRVRAGFRARRRLDRDRKLVGLASFVVMGAMGWWAMGPLEGGFFVLLLVAIAAFVHFRHVLPEERLARRAEQQGTDVLDSYRRDLDKEIQGLRGARQVLIVFGMLLTVNLLLMAGKIVAELVRGRSFPDVESYVATSVIFTIIGVLMWLRGRRALPRLERERAEARRVTALSLESEPALIARCKDAGTRGAAFDEVFAALREQVLAVCLNVTGNTADADDALQETFLAVHAGLPKFRGESRISTWVHRIAIRASIRVRSRRRSAADVHEVDPPARGPDPVLAGELSRRIASAMERLSADHRVVISLFAVDGMGHAQIAEILGVPEGTVWSRLHAARKRLAAELGDAAPTTSQRPE